MLISMRNAIVALLLAVVCGNAMAEWVKVGSNETDALYVDPSTIRHTDNGTAKMWALNDFNVTQHVNEREPFKSEKAEYEYDCNGQQLRPLYFTSHSECMAGGEIVDFNVVPSEWTRVPLDTGLEALWKIACGKA